MKRDKSGAVLLEVMVAVAILGVAGTASVLAAREALVAVERARASDAEMRDAAALADAVSLWTRADLDRRLGARRQGRWMLRVGRLDEELYDVAIDDTAQPGRAVLRTVLFRARADSLEAR